MNSLKHEITIENNLISKKSPCFIIAEAGVNHNGKIEIAKKLIDVASEAGVDAIKFQTFKASKLASIEAEKVAYQKKNTDIEENQYQMLKKLELNEENHVILKKYAADKGIIFLSSPFDNKSIDLLEKLNISAYKIPSGEINNIPYLRNISKKNKPIILSTGMSTIDEIEDAINIISNEGNNKLILLHCVTNYPVDFSDINLKTMNTLKKKFNILVGYSDHAKGINICLAAVSLGAKVIEKHITLDKSMEGPDHKASIEPQELKLLVKGIREIEKSLGDGIKTISEKELKIQKNVRKSIYINQNLKMGDLIKEEMIDLKRPATGISPAFYDKVIGKKINSNIKKGKQLQWEDIE